MKNLVLTLFITLFAFSISNAQKIELKKSFGENFFYQNGEKLTKNKLMDLMKNNSKALELLKSAKSNHTWATILGAAGGGLIGYPLGTAVGGGEAKWELAGAGAALVLVALPIIKNYNKKTKKAVEIYNASQPEVSSSFEPTFNLNIKGAGLAFVMDF